MNHALISICLYLILWGQFMLGYFLGRMDAERSDPRNCWKSEVLKDRKERDS
jgi:hypothetical protein